MENFRTGVYKHYKGKYYLVLGLARHSETEEIFVVYVPLYMHKGMGMSIRPYKMFVEKIEKDGVKQKRFAYFGQKLPEEF